MVSRLWVLFLMYVAIAQFHQRCIFFNGKCVSFCPQKMHIYHTRCDGRTKSQRTCDEPHQYILGYTCGWSRCDCSGDLVLDEQTHNCVDIKDCPTMVLSRRKLEKYRYKEQKKNRKYHKSKRIRITENPLAELEP
ncbi:uncharacterized protein LOC121738702 [Aricia agestis]|uniref:uncharacterized protein LOC121738702 n=1 Tax=Aricia agestis TaxID=91739 RepID=UPI001C207D2E|nr:uncharacterized protein LOC121738702 [Aricia agestis]